MPAAQSSDRAFQLTEISFQNYRNFEVQSFRLHPHFNVFIGVNGTGKTSVLDACAVAVGSLFLGIDGMLGKAIERKDVRRVLLNGQSRLITPVAIATEGWVFDAPLRWERTVDSISPKAKKIVTKYKNAVTLKNAVKKKYDAYMRGAEVTFPVIAYHGTGRLWAQHETPQYVPFQRDGLLLGYKNCLSAKSDSKAFLSWYKTMEDEVRKFERPLDKQLFEAFKTTLTNFVREWADVHYSHSEEDLIGTFTDAGGQQNLLPYSQLSDGYRNAIGMVADIAYRCLLLNPHLGKDAVRRTPGVVLIDELDLHLHPNWQRRIVADLKRTFPFVQFIATTHSPFIVQSLQRTELINLNHLPQLANGEPFAQSIEEVAESFMNMEDVPRSQRFNEMLDTAAQ